MIEDFFSFLSALIPDTGTIHARLPSLPLAVGDEQTSVLAGDSKNHGKRREGSERSKKGEEIEKRMKGARRTAGEMVERGEKSRRLWRKKGRMFDHEDKIKIAMKEVR
ncbi:MAG: hypothetical protein E7256_04690 [Lachnospiraceae bacterium]|nr:hypothetical protein [Lachnospiraceae bacterium]